MNSYRPRSRRHLLLSAALLGSASMLRSWPSTLPLTAADEPAGKQSATPLPPSNSPAAAAARFTDNQDGTVTDPVTGLMWQQTDAGPMSIEEAQQFARKLNLAGHTDWRLPLPMELFCIMDHRLHGPAMNTRWFPASAARYWWTETTRPDASGKYWQVNTGGGIGAHAKTEAINAGGENPVHIRCVRGPSPWKSGPQLTKNPDGTVTDQTTGLVWQQKLHTQVATWDEAQNLCRDLQLAGHSDWRLPSIRELRSISNDRLAQPSLDPDIFSGAASVPCWSATTQQNRPERAWFVDFTSGLVTYRDKTEQMQVLAVRGNSPLTAEPTEPVTQTSRGGGGGGGGGGKAKKGKKGGEKSKPPRPNP